LQIDHILVKYKAVVKWYLFDSLPVLVLPCILWMLLRLLLSLVDGVGSLGCAIITYVATDMIRVTLFRNHVFSCSSYSVCFP